MRERLTGSKFFLYFREVKQPHTFMLLAQGVLLKDVMAMRLFPKSFSAPRG